MSEDTSLPGSFQGAPGPKRLKLAEQNLTDGIQVEAAQKRIATVDRRTFQKFVQAEILLELALRKCTTLLRDPNICQVVLEEFDHAELDKRYLHLREKLLELGYTASSIETELSSLKDYTLSPYYQAPIPNPCFTGRDEVLLETQGAIKQCENGETVYDRAIVITGLTGMGKSEIAKQLSKKLRFRFDLILWFDAGTEAGMDYGFKILAKVVLGIKLLSEHQVTRTDRLQIYKSLGENYHKVLFIFDNAEALKSVDEILGVEEYLQPENMDKKPVFLITSRHLKDDWQKAGMKCLELNAMTTDESYTTLLKTLNLEGRIISNGLEERIRSLAKLVEGHALGLKIIGSTIADAAHDVQSDLERIDSRVEEYIRILSHLEHKDLPEQEKYESILGQICNSIIEDIRKGPHGKIAEELLNIISLLAPDEIGLGLLNDIFEEPVPLRSTKSLRSFVWDDIMSNDVKEGLNILIRRSLIKIARFEDQIACQVRDVVKIHRMVQHCIRKSSLQSKNFSFLNKTMRTFVSYLESGRFLPWDLPISHRSFRSVLNYYCSLTDLQSIDVPIAQVLRFLTQFPKRDLKVFDQMEMLLCKHKVRASDSDKSLLRILKYVTFPERFGDQNHSMQDDLMCLGSLMEHNWVISFVSGLIRKFRLVRTPTVGSWLVKTYIKHREHLTCHFVVLDCVHRCDPIRDWTQDQELLLAACDDSRSQQDSLLKDVLQFVRRIGRNIRALTGFMKLFIPAGGHDLLSQLVLNPNTRLGSDDVSQKVVVDLYGYLTRAARGMDWSSELASSEDFAECFLRIIRLTTNNRFHGLLTEPIYILNYLCSVFIHSKEFYDRVGQDIDSAADDWIRLRKEKGKLSIRIFEDLRTPWHPHKGYYGIAKENHMQEFQNVSYCSDQTKAWIEKMSELEEDNGKQDPR